MIGFNIEQGGVMELEKMTIDEMTTFAGEIVGKFHAGIGMAIPEEALINFFESFISYHTPQSVRGE